MNKSALKALFINAKAFDARYIGVRIQTEGSSQPETIINPRENFDSKFEYYMKAYDDDLILISAKGAKEIRITGIAQGNTFEDIEFQLCDVGIDWKKPIADAIDRVCDRMLKENPPESEEERIQYEGQRETIKGFFLNQSRTAAGARFIFNNIEKYEEIFEVCMNGSDLEFKKGLIELQRLQNEEILKEEAETS